MSTLLAPERSTWTGRQTQPHGAPEPLPVSRTRRMLAGSGFVMLGFVVVHLAGNLLAFAGPVPFNAYARWLREVGSPLVPESGLLWVARVVLGVTLAVHLASHLSLMRHPDSSPPVASAGLMPPWYAVLPLAVFQTTGGLIVLFGAFHLAQLTIGTIHPAFVAGDPYDNTIVALRYWPVSFLYIGAAVAVGVHLLPGAWTGLRSLGLIRPGTTRLAGIVSPGVALVVALGMSAVPLAVLLGVLT